jgi:diadenosine tetraphosphatase ApaH/serine/threonine PP2A family protein phosphatase
LKIGLISDIHGNLEALTAALRSLEKRRVDRLYCLGDVVGYGANPGECLELVREKAELQLMGNHDAAAAGIESLEKFNPYAREAAIWTQRILSGEQRQFLAGLPYEVIRGQMHLVHSAPAHPQGWDYIFSALDAYRQFGSAQAPDCFVGHSHLPGEYWEGAAVGRRENAERRIINIGSVGQPRDRDSRLCFVIFDEESREVQFVREDYDVETASRKILEAGLPPFLAQRLFFGQ